MYFNAYACSCKVATKSYAKGKYNKAARGNFFTFSQIVEEFIFE